VNFPLSDPRMNPLENGQIAVIAISDVGSLNAFKNYLLTSYLFPIDMIKKT
jgi:hypothetical protein